MAILVSSPGSSAPQTPWNYISQHALKLVWPHLKWPRRATRMVSFDSASLCHNTSMLIDSYQGFNISRRSVFELWSLNEGVVDWEHPCIPSIGWGSRAVTLAISRIGGNVDQGAPLRPVRGAGTGARAECERSRIRTLAPERLEVEDEGTWGTCGQWAFAAPGLHLQSRVCQHVWFPGQSPQTGKRGWHEIPWAFAVGVGVGWVRRALGSEEDTGLGEIFSSNLGNCTRWWRKCSLTVCQSSSFISGAPNGRRWGRAWRGG